MFNRLKQRLDLLCSLSLPLLDWIFDETFVIFLLLFFMQLTDLLRLICLFLISPPLLKSYLSSILSFLSQLLNSILILFVLLSDFCFLKEPLFLFLDPSRLKYKCSPLLFRPFLILQFKYSSSPFVFSFLLHLLECYSMVLLLFQCLTLKVFS